MLSWFRRGISDCVLHARIDQAPTAACGLSLAELRFGPWEDGGLDLRTCRNCLAAVKTCDPGWRVEAAPTVNEDTVARVGSLLLASPRPLSRKELAILLGMPGGRVSEALHTPELRRCTVQDGDRVRWKQDTPTSRGPLAVELWQSIALERSTVAHELEDERARAPRGKVTIEALLAKHGATGDRIQSIARTAAEAGVGAELTSRQLAGGSRDGADKAALRRLVDCGLLLRFGTRPARYRVTPELAGAARGPR